MNQSDVPPRASDSQVLEGSDLAPLGGATEPAEQSRAAAFSVPQITATLLGFYRDPIVRVIFVLASVVTLLLNLPYYLDFKPHRGSSLALALAGSWLSTFCFFLLLTAHRVLLYALLPLSLLVCGAAIYFMQELGVYVNENTLGLVYETNLGEAHDLLSGKLVSYALLALALGIWIAWTVRRALSRGGVGRRVALVAGLFTVHLLTALQTRALEVYDPPIGLFTNSYIYFRETNRASDLLRLRRDISTQARLAPTHTSEEEYVVVVVVGETVRPDHLHINGYPRPTTPELERLGVLSFSDVRACATNTRFAVPCLLTRGTKADPRRPYEETSLVSVFRGLGFESSWISLQGRFWEAIVPTEYTVAATAAIASEAEHVAYLNPTGDLAHSERYDTELLGPLDEALARKAPRKFVLLHTAGAHFQYASRYPARHNHYEPVCRAKRPRGCAPLDLNNAYDNAMHFQDEFLSSVIERLTQRNALFVYVSDHGESLGEGGHYLHHLDSPEPEQNRAAMLVWASDTFRSKHPASLEALAKNRSKKLAHEHVFHTVLDCAGVQLPYIDPTRSLCREVTERADELAPNRLSISF